MIQLAFGKHDIDFSHKNVDDILHPEYDVTLQGIINVQPAVYTSVNEKRPRFTIV